MAQETQNVSLDQGVMMSKFTEIAKWMQTYEQHRYDEERKAKNLPTEALQENAKTQIQSVEGYCTALSLYLINDVIVDDEKSKSNPSNRDTAHVDEFYDRIHLINSCKIPPEPGKEKEFYHEVNSLMMILYQLQEAYVIDPTKEEVVKKDVNSLLMLNNAAPINSVTKNESRRASIHTYCFTDNAQLLKWGQEAQLGDTLLVQAEYHSMALYVRANDKGEKVVGFYDPNNARRLEIVQSELKDVTQIKEFKPFIEEYKRKGNENKYPSIVLCHHIVAEQEPAIRVAPEIKDSPLNVLQLKSALHEISNYSSLTLQCSLIKQQIEFAKQGDIKINIALAEASFRNRELSPFIKPAERIEYIKQLSDQGNNEASAALLNIQRKYTNEYNDVSGDLDKFTQSAKSDPELGNAMMLFAASNWRTDIVQTLITSGIDVNAKDTETKKTALMYALEKYNLDVADLLISSKADVNAKDSAGKVLLDMFPDSQRQSKLIAAGARIDPTKLQDYLRLIEDGYADLVGPALIKTAIENKNAEVLLQLLDKGIKIDDAMVLELVGDFSQEPKIIDVIIKQAKQNSQYLSAIIKYGQSLMTRGGVYDSEINHYYSQIITPLLTSGIDFNTIAPSGYTLWHNIALNGSKELAEELLRINAPLEVETKGVFTPLCLAARWGNAGVVASLLDANSRMLNHVTDRGAPIHVAIKFGENNITQMLCDRGCDVNIQDKAGITPLKYAIDAPRSADVIALLITKGAQLDDVMFNECMGKINGDWGRENGDKSNELVKALLFYAVKNDKPEMLSALLKTTKCDVLVQDDSRRTALSYAQEKRHDNVVAILEPIVTAKLAERVTHELHAAKSEHVEHHTSHSNLHTKEPRR